MKDIYNKRNISLGHTELKMNADELIVSKTDIKGVVTYGNDSFCDIAGYDRSEIIGKPHNILRHPDMPRIVFKYAWDELSAGRPVYAFVKNMSKSGDFYWVYAYITPSYVIKGWSGPDKTIPKKELVGFHSERRMPNVKALEIIVPLYQKLKSIEIEQGMDKALEYLISVIGSIGESSYQSLIQKLQDGTIKG
ncbi:MAG: PAS domain-containing protein [Patescibacteria group bacterium]|nr:PAS domain-containing protein [Patescibacteria group bacterium]